jgi:hypothetical protein
MTSSERKAVLDFIAEGLKTENSFAVRQQAFMKQFGLSLDYQVELIAEQSRSDCIFTMKITNEPGGDASTVFVSFYRR